MTKKEKASYSSIRFAKARKSCLYDSANHGSVAILSCNAFTRLHNSACESKKASTANEFLATYTIKILTRIFQFIEVDANRDERIVSERHHRSDQFARQIVLSILYRSLQRSGQPREQTSQQRAHALTVKCIDSGASEKS